MSRGMILLTPFLLFLATLPQYAWAADKSLGVAFSAGIPDLLNFQAHWLKLGWLRFGYGLGTQPVESVIKRFADIDPNEFVYDVNEQYSVRPVPTLGLRSYNSFARLFPGTESFYLEAKYISWRVSASVQAIVINRETGAEFSAGAVSFRVIQPLVGGGIGWQFIADSGLFLDAGVGAYYLCRTDAAYGFSGALGAGIVGSVLDPEINTQIADAKKQINYEIETAIREMRKVATVIPGLYLSLGWAF